MLGLLAIGVITMPLTVHGQRPAKVVRIGFLGAESAGQTQSNLDLLRTGLRELGYVEGTGLVFEVRAANGEYGRLPSLARELAGSGIDVLVTSGSKAGIAAKESTAVVPIVVSNMGDAVQAGFSGSLANPGSNVTGVSMMNPEVTVKQLELLREVKPGIVRVAALMNPANPNYALTIAAVRRASEGFKVHVERFDVQRADELEPTMRAAANAGFTAMIVQSETLFGGQAAMIANLATKHRIAAAGISSFARVGGLIGYSASSRERWRHVAAYVDRIVRGTKPAELPIVQPTKFELVINTRTAKRLGLAIPQSLLLRADEVLE
jgi:putative ABC transport system substrate-binding protein